MERGKASNLSWTFGKSLQRCPKEVSSYYAKIVGKKKAEEDESEEDEEEIDLSNKKQKQTSISHYYKYQKLEEGRADEIDKSITKPL